jgi:hypothetical protein
VGAAGDGGGGRRDLTRGRGEEGVEEEEDAASWASVARCKFVAEATSKSTRLVPPARAQLRRFSTLSDAGHMASPGHWCFCSLVPGDRGISYKTVRTGTAIPTATGHGGRWRRLLPFILPQCGTVKATQSFRSSGRTPHPASSGTNATCGAAYPRAIPNHPRPAAGLPSPMPSPLTQQKHQLVPELGNRPCPAVAELHHVAHPLGSSAPPLRPPGSSTPPPQLAPAPSTTCAAR